VVERVHRNTAVIPIRYGSLMSDEAAVIDLLIDKSSEYRVRLSELEGCEEMGIRLPMMAPEPDPNQGKKPSSGHEYLMSLKRKYSPTEQAVREADELDRALLGLYRKRCGEAGLFANKPMYLVSYLVHKSQLDAFRAKVDELFEAGAHKGIISGPWPPYNFSV